MSNPPTPEKHLQVNLDDLRRIRDEGRAAGGGSPRWLKAAMALMDAFPAVYETAQRMNADAQALRRDRAYLGLQVRHLEGQRGVLLGWIKSALLALEVVGALEDFEDGGQALEELRHAGQQLLAAPLCCAACDQPNGCVEFCRCVPGHLKPVGVAWRYPSGEPYTLTWFGEDEKRITQGSEPGEFGREVLYGLSSGASPETPLLLKGIGKIAGDGFKDTTKIGGVVFVWNQEKSEPYAPGQYPRLGNPIWSASTEQYAFFPVPNAEFSGVVDQVIEELRAEMHKLQDRLRAQSSSDLTLTRHAVTDRMPDADTDVLIWDASSEHSQLGAYLGDDDEGPLWVNAQGEGVASVTHWAEMP